MPADAQKARVAASLLRRFSIQLVRLGHCETEDRRLHLHPLLLIESKSRDSLPNVRTEAHSATGTPGATRWNETIEKRWLAREDQHGFQECGALHAHFHA